MNNKIIKELDFFKVGFHSYRESYIDYIISYYRLNTEYTNFNTALKAIAGILKYVLIYSIAILFFNDFNFEQVNSGIIQELNTMFDADENGKGYFVVIMFSLFIFVMFDDKFNDRARIKTQCEIVKDRIFTENKYAEKDIKLFDQTMIDVEEMFKEDTYLYNEIISFNAQIREEIKKKNKEEK